MKSVLISIQPKWVEKICSGEKTIEVRKSRPKVETPFKCYIYCTKQKPYLYKEANPPFELFLDRQLYMGGSYEDRFLSGKVIGEFVCDKVYLIKNRGSMFSVADEEQSVTNEIARQSCLDYDDMVSYLGNKDGYGWHISDLKIYDKPKDLSEFKTGCKGCKERDTYHCKFYCYGGRPLTRPPQSWQYVEELTNEQIYNTVIFN